MNHRDTEDSERLKRRAFRFLLRLCVLCVSVVQSITLPALAGPPENLFFTMDTGIRGEPAEVAATLSDLGYAGLGGSPGNAGAMATALEAKGLRFFNAYTTLKITAGTTVLTPVLRLAIDDLAGRHSALWLAIASVQRDDAAPFPKSSADADETAATALRELAAYASPKGVKLALYPHTNMWLERVEDCLRLAARLDDPNIGVTFNLCHWLRVEGERDPLPLLRSALPRLLFVTINGADGGATQTMGWDRLIQPLDAGSYDVAGFLRQLRALGYTGPIGLQAFGIKGDPRENLRRSMAAWQRMKETTP